MRPCLPPQRPVRRCTVKPSPPRAIFEAAARGDTLAQSLVDDEAQLLGQGFVCLIHILSPQAIILGGGMSQAFDQLASGINAFLAAHVKAGFDGVRLCRASLGTASSLIGAACLVFRPDLAAHHPA